MTWVLVTGGRDYSLFGELSHIMDKLHEEYAFTFLVHGDCHWHGKPAGADMLAGKWAEARGVQQIKVPANWNGEARKGAGHERNQLMLNLFRPDVIVAFPGGAGTYDMIKRAHAEGIKIIDTISVFQID